MAALLALAATAAQPRTPVRVRASHTAAVGAHLHTMKRWGSVLFENGEGIAVAQGSPVLSAVAGRADDGREVIALLDQPVTATATARPLSSLTFAKPPALSHAEAAAFPLIALRAAAALERVGVELTASPREITGELLIIAGSSGRLPPLLTELCLHAGVRPMVAAQAKDIERLRQIGADTVDHNELSFSACMPPHARLRGVIDCVGSEETPQVLQEQLGAPYVSLASPELTQLVTEGVLVSAFNSFRSWRQPPPQCIWAASAEAGHALGAMLQLLSASSLRPPADVADQVELAEQYAEALSWTRDCDTGLRLGFLGKDLWLPPMTDPRLREVEQDINMSTREQEVARLESLLEQDNLEPPML